MTLVIADKVFHKGQMYGHISSGGGLVNVSHGIALKFISLNNQFITIQVLHNGVGIPIKTQSWVKTKAVVKKVKQTRLELDTEVKEEALI